MFLKSINIFLNRTSHIIEMISYFPDSFMFLVALIIGTFSSKFLTSGALNIGRHCVLKKY